MKLNTFAEGIEELQIDIEDMIDAYFETQFGVEVMWESEELFGNTLTITNVNLSGLAEDVQDAIDTLATDDEY